MKPQTIPFDKPKTIPFSANKTVTPTSPAPTQSLSDNIWSNIVGGVKQNVNSIVQSQKDSMSGKVNPFVAGANMAKNVTEAVLQPLTQTAGKVAGKVLNPVVDFASKKLGNTQAVQDFAALMDKHPDLGNLISDITQTGVNTISLATIGEGGAKATNAGIDTLKPVVKTVVNTGSNAVTTGIDTIENIGRKFSAPEVSEATKVSLNPQEALKGSGQDIKVSVGGKIKNLSEITPTENMRIQASTGKSLEKFTKQAEMFAKDRSVKGGSPVEIVGNRVDSALEFANKKRQAIGSKMGEIENKYVSNPLPIGEKTLNTFSETLKSIDNPKYGVDTANAPIVQKLIKDFDSLEKGGATIGERLDFVRSWDKYLNDAKDAFGNFKENTTVNTRIQNAIKVLKDETVDAISGKDKVYRDLRTSYRTYKQLDEIGDGLLGKDGALGQRIKGASTIKRAIQSNSDAGARQFLTKLKELTGYDAIKEGDIALTAMENVGDYQGLSLLNILKEGKGGMFKRAAELVRDKLVGDNATRVKNYIKK